MAENLNLRAQSLNEDTLLGERPLGSGRLMSLDSTPGV
jgi:hypothetical protein